MYICLRHKMKKRETGVLGGLRGRSRDQKLEDTNIFRIPLSVRKNIFYFLVALSCWPCTFHKFYWRSPIAMCSVLAGLRASADGRPSPGSPARPRLHLPTCCPPPSSRRRRRAPVARGCVCPPFAPRGRPRAGAALPSPAAAAPRLLPAAVGAAQAPRSPRPRLRLPVCFPPPASPRWRRALFARGCRCAPGALRRRPLR